MFPQRLYWTDHWLSIKFHGCLHFAVNAFIYLDLFVYFSLRKNTQWPLHNYRKHCSTLLRTPHTHTCRLLICSARGLSLIINCVPTKPLFLFDGISLVDYRWTCYCRFFHLFGTPHLLRAVNLSNKPIRSQTENTKYMFGERKCKRLCNLLAARPQAINN